jgi:3'-5' exoribonuclease
MRELYIKDFREGDEITDFFIAKNPQIKTGSNGKYYFDFFAADATGELPAKKWDLDDAETRMIKELSSGAIVKIRASVTDWRGQKQLRVARIRLADEGDADRYEKADLFKTAPEPSEEMYAFLMDKINGFEDEDLKNLCAKLFEENRDRLMYYPAAMTNHHAEYGGLLYHVKRMVMMGERACEVYTNLSRDLLLAGVIIHDIEKMNEILSDENGVSPGYSFEGQMLGHIVQGVKTISRACEELGIDREKSILLEHMVLTHHYEPEFGSPKKPLFPEAEMLHYLDMIDAKMFDMEDALRNVEPGDFGEKVWTLDNRKPYKRTF